MELLRTAVSISGGVAFAMTIPGTLEILLVTVGALRRAKQPDAVAHEDLKLGIVIPAHNEAPIIARCVRSIAASAARTANCRIVVVADNCTDETAARAREVGAHVLVRQNAELRGKGHALRLAFDQLRAEGSEAFLVVDADSIVSSNLVMEVKRHLSSGSTAVQTRYLVLNPNAAIRTRLMDLALLAFNVLRPKGRSFWGLSAGILGNGFALRAETLRMVPWDADSIVEDLEYHLRLVAAGGRVDFIDSAAVFGEMPSADEASRVQRSRWEGGRLRMAREWAPKLAVQILRGKMRLTEPLLDLLTFPLAYHAMLLAFALIACSGYFRMGAAAATALVMVHVLWASRLGGQFWQSAMALAAAPFYVVWKVTTLGRVFSASRPNAGWVRTGRDEGPGLRPAEIANEGTRL